MEKINGYLVNEAKLDSQLPVALQAVFSSAPDYAVDLGAAVTNANIVGRASYNDGNPNDDIIWINTPLTLLNIPIWIKYSVHHGSDDLPYDFDILIDQAGNPLLRINIQGTTVSKPQGRIVFKMVKA